MHKWGRLGFVRLTLGLAIAGRQNASALTKEDALENCRATVGRPIVQACIRGGGGSREACREQASPKVRACVIAALNAANGRANVPIAVPKEQGPSDAVADRAEALPSIFVVPPRTSILPRYWTARNQTLRKSPNCTLKRMRQFRPMYHAQNSHNFTISAEMRGRNWGAWLTQL